MNEQAQIAALLLAGFIAGGDPSDAEMQMAGAEAPDRRPQIESISETGCRLLTRHVPAENVAYRPGVSATGKRVVPADLAGRLSYRRHPVYEFGVRIEPFPVSSKFNAQSYLEVATVTFDPDTRRITVDGEELVWLHEKALLEACARQAGEKDGDKGGGTAEQD